MLQREMSGKKPQDNKQMCTNLEQRKFKEDVAMWKYKIRKYSDKKWQLFLMRTKNCLQVWLQEHSSLLQRYCWWMILNPVWGTGKLRQWFSDPCHASPVLSVSQTENIAFPSVIGNEIRYPARMPSLYLTQFRVVSSEFPWGSFCGKDVWTNIPQMLTNCKT